VSRPRELRIEARCDDGRVAVREIVADHERTPECLQAWVVVRQGDR
jgi:hypothetical protein